MEDEGRIIFLTFLHVSAEEGCKTWANSFVPPGVQLRKIKKIK